MQDILVGIFLPVLGVLVAIVAPLWEFVLRDRRRLGYRVQMVAKIPGSIGYSDLLEAQTAAKQHPEVETIQIDGRDASPDNVKQHLYPFWQTEYAYTYNGEPAPDSLAASFLDYLTTNAAKQVIRASSDIPCADLPNAACQP